MLMEIKDWILLLVPIACNGFIVFLFQKLISKKIDRTEKRNALRDETLMLFWKHLQGLNDLFIKTNKNVANGSQSLLKGLEEIRDKVLEIVQFYDTNSYDLKTLSEEFAIWENSWNNFSVTLVSNSSKPLTREIQRQLAVELQDVKDNTKTLIEAIRKKY